MRREIQWTLAVCAAAGLACSGAMASIVNSTADYGSKDHPGAQSGGYGSRGGGAVVPDDRANMSLFMLLANDGMPFINQSGGDNEVHVLRGNTFTDIGRNANGAGRVLAKWDEMLSGGRCYINAVWMTSNGEQFMPNSVATGSNPAVAWSYHFGFTTGANRNPVTFQPWITRVNMVNATIFLSSNQGSTFHTQTDITNTLPSNWIGGGDDGELISNIGDGTNFMLIRYEIEPIPAPTGLALAGVAGAVLTGRRKRQPAPPANPPATQNIPEELMTDAYSYAGVEER